MPHTVKKWAAGFLALLLTVALTSCTSKKGEGASGSSNPTSSSPALTSNAGVTSPTSDAMGQAAYKDGTYTAEDDYNEDGYKAVVTAVIQAGKLTTLTCDEIDRAGGSKKTLSETGQYGMKEKGGAAAQWHEEVAAFETAVVEKGLAAIPLGTDGKTDAVAGCTISVSRFAVLIQEALDKAAA